MSTSDEQLAAKAQGGDRQALGILIERYQGRVFSMTYRILTNRQDALDASQEVFLRVLRHLRSYCPDRPFAPWIRSIAVRVALDCARRNARGNGGRVSVDAISRAGADPLEAACTSETAAKVMHALNLLSPAQRAAFICKEIEGMDTRATARAMGIKKGTVRFHLFEARRRLAEQLLGLRGDEE